MNDGRVIFSAVEIDAIRTLLDTSISVVENMNVEEHRSTSSPETRLLVSLESCVTLGVTVEALQPGIQPGIKPGDTT